MIIDVFFVACDSYSVPEHIQPHIDLIKPTVQFDRRPIQPARSGQNEKRDVPSFPAPKAMPMPDNLRPELDNCDQMITLDCLRALYSFNYTPIATDKNSFGVRKESSFFILILLRLNIFC